MLNKQCLICKCMCLTTRLTVYSKDIMEKRLSNFCRGIEIIASSLSSYYSEFLFISKMKMKVFNILSE